MSSERRDHLRRPDPTNGANVMDDTEAIASRLHKFIQAAQRKASASTRLHRFIQMARPAPARSTKRKAEILKVYEKCLGELTDEESAELDRIVGIMSGALGDPLGAIPPP